MRLINTTTLTIEEFSDELPEYAILSHTWDKEEISFQEFQLRDQITTAKAGFQKIVRCCETAQLQGINWAWIDTCCIDKTSSAELSNAINSMFNWYQRSKMCFVYLGDVTKIEGVDETLSEFKRSRWFTRGWTVS
jgi:Heterokaryon incompatibility protein (HET)